MHLVVWRRIAGGAATLLAAIASIATSVGSDHYRLHLPDQAISLTAGSPEHHSRFRVESNSGRYELELRLDVEGNATTQLDVLPIGANAGRVVIETPNDDDLATNRTMLHLNVNVECAAEFPCVSEFEATVTASAGSVWPVTGTLRITAEMDRSGSDPRGTYLAIEPIQRATD